MDLYEKLGYQLILLRHKIGERKWGEIDSIIALLNEYIINELSEMNDSVSLILCDFFTIAMKRLDILFNDKNLEEAYDLIDAIHVLPHILTASHRDMASFWDIYIEAYENKWNLELFDSLKDEIVNF
jgi:hypothetical protein